MANKKKKLSELNVIDGKVDEQFNEKEQTFEPTTLSQLWGDTGLTKYGTFSLAEYKAQIDEMNLSDLRTHSAKMGILPATNRERLVKRLLSDFQRYVASFQKPRQVPNKKKDSIEALKIMREVV